jgi:sugar phosphate isomerase/epimerase
MNRREFIRETAALTAAAGAVVTDLSATESGAAPPRRMTICLVGASIGVSANQVEAIRLAQKHGFESVEPQPQDLASLADARLKELLVDLRTKELAWGAAGLPVKFRQDDERFASGLKELPRLAAALQRAGVTRMGTWLSPCHGTLTYVQNLKRHAERLRQVAKVLGDHGLRLGLEYVGPRTSLTRARFPFIHTLAETKDLITEIGLRNVGFVLDSWHWYTAGDTVEDLRSLTAEQIVAVDLNDAPAGIPVEQQIDNRRELPCATGVIDLAAFLHTLHRLGYDGPVRAEPFNRALNELDNEAACVATIAAMRKAFELIR